eukprot:9107828-Karenia_brevis.AAC.1
MRQWLGKQLVLSPDAEEELFQQEKHSSRVPIAGRLTDYVEPECVDEVHNVDSWQQYVNEVLGPKCDDPIYLN